ncbi:hypothetical protein EDB87DRAFT_974719 [Lactarius vividus]|nr:hypothetical protein EDB87DRAFT_974719 [Lactarius vividus]
MSPLFPSSPIISLQAMSSVQNTTLLVDGYISQTFRSRVAEQYFLDLLKSTVIPAHTTLSYPERRGYFFFTNSVPSHIPVQHSSSPGHWLLDRSIVHEGTVVPQAMWSPQSAHDRKRLVVTAQLQMPIFFESDRRLGISLAASTSGRCYDLREANHPAPLGHKASTYIRIIWPGYKEFKRQIPIREPTGTHDSISIAGFVRHIGRTVEAFLQDCELDPGSVDNQRGLWRIGPSGIQNNDIVIIGAIQVSTGSWMPILQLGRYIF